MVSINFIPSLILPTAFFCSLCISMSLIYLRLPIFFIYRAILKLGVEKGWDTSLAKHHLLCMCNTTEIKDTDMRCHTQHESIYYSHSSKSKGLCWWAISCRSRPAHGLDYLLLQPLVYRHVTPSLLQSKRCFSSSPLICRGFDPISASVAFTDHN